MVDLVSVGNKNQVLLLVLSPNTRPRYICPPPVCRPSRRSRPARLHCTLHEVCLCLGGIDARAALSGSFDDRWQAAEGSVGEGRFEELDVCRCTPESVSSPFACD